MGEITSFQIISIASTTLLGIVIAVIGYFIKQELATLKTVVNNMNTLIVKQATSEISVVNLASDVEEIKEEQKELKKQVDTISYDMTVIKTQHKYNHEQDLKLEHN